MKWKILLAMVLLALFPVFLIDPNPKASQQSLTLQELPAAVPNPTIAPAFRSDSQFRYLIYEADPTEGPEPILVQEQQQAPAPQQQQPQQVEPERGYGWGYYWWWWIIIGGIIIFFIIIFAAWGGWGGGRRGGGPPPPDDRDRM
jgi:hypothetical protein